MSDGMFGRAWLEAPIGGISQDLDLEGPEPGKPTTVGWGKTEAPSYYQMQGGSHASKLAQLHYEQYVEYDFLKEKRQGMDCKRRSGSLPVLAHVPQSPTAGRGIPTDLFQRAVSDARYRASRPSSRTGEQGSLVRRRNERSLSRGSISLSVRTSSRPSTPTTAGGPASADGSGSETGSSPSTSRSAAARLLQQGLEQSVELKSPQTPLPPVLPPARRAPQISCEAFEGALQSLGFQFPVGCGVQTSDLFRALDSDGDSWVCVADLRALENFPPSSSAAERVISAVIGRRSGEIEVVAADFVGSRETVDKQRITECIMISCDQEDLARKVSSALMHLAAGAVEAGKTTDWLSAPQAAMWHALAAYRVVMAMALVSDFRSQIKSRFRRCEDVFVVFDPNKTGTVSWANFVKVVKQSLGNETEFYLRWRCTCSDYRFHRASRNLEARSYRCRRHGASLT